MLDLSLVRLEKYNNLLVSNTLALFPVKYKELSEQDQKHRQWLKENNYTNGGNGPFWSYGEKPIYEVAMDIAFEEAKRAIDYLDKKMQYKK